MFGNRPRSENRPESAGGRQEGKKEQTRHERDPSIPEDTAREVDPTEPFGADSPAASQSPNDGVVAEDESQPSRVATLAAERDELQQKFLRAMADFQNYRRNALRNEQEARLQGTSAVLHQLLPVLDNFDMALGQDASKASVNSILDGVKAIRASFIKALETQGVSLIAPAPNDEFDPNQHQAITQQPAEGVQRGHVAALFQPGYAIGDRVIRPAKISVAPSA
ncbi:MAG: nucleotide exchange factor GrpE [Phycisphaerales bacterium]|nr:nucleotide exchange factor GrpE [Phycisphaerales bacterium]